MSQNLQIIVGRVVADAKKISDNLAEVRIATNHWNSQKSEDEATFHTVNICGKGAVFASTIEKGDLVSVQGRTEHQLWNEKYYTKVVSFNIQREAKKGAGAGGQASNQSKKPAIAEDDIPF